jgi:hypothetical protein
VLPRSWLAPFPVREKNRSGSAPVWYSNTYSNNFNTHGACAGRARTQYMRRLRPLVYGPARPRPVRRGRPSAGRKPSRPGTVTRRADGARPKLAASGKIAMSITPGLHAHIRALASLMTNQMIGMPRTPRPATWPSQPTKCAGIRGHLHRLPPIHGRSVRTTLSTAPMRDPPVVDRCACQRMGCCRISRCVAGIPLPAGYRETGIAQFSLVVLAEGVATVGQAVHAGHGEDAAGHSSLSVVSGRIGRN